MVLLTDATYHRCPTSCALSSFCRIIFAFAITFTILMSSTIAQSDLSFAPMPSALIQCTPTNISWSGGIPPFDLTIVSAGVATPLQLYPGLTGFTLPWSTNISAGTTVSFQLTDAGGDIAVSQTALAIQPGSDSCLPMSMSTTTTSQTTLSSRSSSDAVTLSQSSTAASATGSAAESITKPYDLGPGPYSGIAIGGAFAIAGVVLLLVMVRRRCRRRVSRGPRVDLDESPRMTGATTPPWRSSSIRLRPPTIYVPSSRKMSQLYEQHSPSTPDSIPLHELVGRSRGSDFSSSPSPASSQPGPSGLMSKRSFLARRGATRSESISRPLPRPPGLDHDHAVQPRPLSLPLEHYADPARGPRQELDGGVRLAGGPPEDEWDRLSDLLPTIPPPYRRYTR